MELERCPKCGALGEIDEDQREGRVSIICSECGYHYMKILTANSPTIPAKKPFLPASPSI